MQNAVRDDNGNIIGFKEGTEKPKAEYNKAHKTMLFYMGTLNPNAFWRYACFRRKDGRRFKP